MGKLEGKFAVEERFKEGYCRKSRSNRTKMVRMKMGKLDMMKDFKENKLQEIAGL